MDTVLITGGAGSLGRILCDRFVARGDKVRCFDINEHALSQINHPKEQFTKIHGDVADYKAIYKAARGVTILIHCAALKNIEITEISAPSCIKTNIIGTQYVAEAAMERKVKYATFISSDKAIEPTTLYGATKQTGEHLWKAAGRIQKDTHFNIVRSGNFFESNGNVFELWNRQKNAGVPLTLTDPLMQRYFIEADDLADIILTYHSIQLFSCPVIIPKMREYNIYDLMILKYGEDVEHKVIGRRQGEKQREKLTSDDEIKIFEDDKVRVMR